jgi:hypothetical protein
MGEPAKHTAAQFVRSRYPTARREHGALGYQIVADGETLGRAYTPNKAWEVARAAVVKAEGRS